VKQAVIDCHSFRKPSSFSRLRDDGCIVADHHDDDVLYWVATSSDWAGKQQHAWRLDETMHRAYAILEAARNNRTVSVSRFMATRRSWFIVAWHPANITDLVACWCCYVEGWNTSTYHVQKLWPGEPGKVGGSSEKGQK
jgi:hypothetical protein